MSAAAGALAAVQYNDTAIEIARARAAVRLLQAIKNGDLDTVNRWRTADDPADCREWWEDMCLTTVEEALDRAATTLAATLAARKDAVAS